MPRAKRPEEEHSFKISISFYPEDYKALIKYCEMHERTLAWVIRRALRDFLEKHKDDPVV